MSILQLLESARKVDAIMLRYLCRGLDEVFLPVVLHQTEAGGKRIRPAFTLASCEAAGGREEDALVPAAMIELIHNYSLIMDDIIDKGMIRRGLPTVRAKYSEVMALLAGMFYREVLDEIAEDCPQPTKMRTLLIDTIKETIEGERLDILFEQAGRNEEYIVQNRFANVPLNLYLNMIGKKTAHLIQAACVAGGISANAKDSVVETLSKFGWSAGMAFQVIDDFLDVFGEKTGKEKGKDILEHKLGNAAIILSLEELSQEDKVRLMTVLRKERVTDTDAQQAFRLIAKTQTRARTQKLAFDFLKECKEALSELSESSGRTKLEALADFVVSRVY